MRKLHPALLALHAEFTETPSATAPTTQQLQETLLEVLEQIDTESGTFILVDAPDEIPFDTRHIQKTQIAGLLNTLAKSQAPGLRMLMTSRPHGDLLKSFASTQSTWREHPIPEDMIQADIELYVRAAIENPAEEWNLDQSSQSRLLARLAGPKQTM